jgi:hypothetical protein
VCQPIKTSTTISEQRHILVFAEGQGSPPFGWQRFGRKERQGEESGEGEETMATKEKEGKLASVGHPVRL